MGGRLEIARAVGEARCSEMGRLKIAVKKLWIVRHYLETGEVRKKRGAGRRMEDEEARELE